MDLNFIGLPKNHAESYHHYMLTNFFSHIDIDPKNAHILDGNATDLQAECDRYETSIKEAGGIHLFIGGNNNLCPSRNVQRLSVNKFYNHNIMVDPESIFEEDRLKNIPLTYNLNSKKVLNPRNRRWVLGCGFTGHATDVPIDINITLS